MHIDWAAHMIAPCVELGAAPLFRKEFTLERRRESVASARLAISSLGIFEARLNGRPVGDDVLSPGWSAYEWRIRYRTVRRDRPARRRNGAGGIGRERVVPRTPRLHGRTGDLRGSTRRHRPARHRVHGRAPAASGDRRDLDRHGVGCAGGRSVRRPDDRRPAAQGRVVRAVHTDPRTCSTSSRCIRSGPSSSTRSILEPYIGPEVRRQDVVAPVEILTSPSGRTHRRLRPEPRRLGPVHRAGSGGKRDQDSSRRGAGARRAGHSTIARRPGDRPVHPQWRVGRIRADQDVPRLPLRRGVRMAR